MRLDIIFLGHMKKSSHSKKNAVRDDKSRC